MRSLDKGSLAQSLYVPEHMMRLGGSFNMHTMTGIQNVDLIHHMMCRTD